MVLGRSTRPHERGCHWLLATSAIRQPTLVASNQWHPHGSEGPDYLRLGLSEQPNRSRAVRAYRNVDRHDSRRPGLASAGSGTDDGRGEHPGGTRGAERAGP
jgi:hypothetical protein